MFPFTCGQNLKSYIAIPPKTQASKGIMPNRT
jgi:hypothetical protein